MSRKRPNVLLFFTDQQRFDTIHALGNPVIRTPNLDRLVHEGTAFTSAYSPSPVCVPARCSMIYGQYPQHTGCYDNRFPMPTDDRRTFMGELTEAGYRTHGIGKCHFTPDSNALRGFQTRERQEELRRDIENDEYLQFLHGAGYRYVLDPHGVRGEMYYVPQPSQLPQHMHPTNWIGDRSVAFVEERESSDQPWFLFSSFIHPHPPFCPPNPWHKLYRAPLMPLPNVPQDSESLHVHINKVQNRYKYRDQGIDQNLMRNIRAYYWATISFIDYQVGRVLDALERTGQLDDTLILYTSDHGEHLGDYNCFGKRSMHDSCARVPMLARMPGRFQAGTVCTRPTSLVDVLPTILSAADVSPTTHAPDGEDLADVAAGSTSREMVFSQFEKAGQAVYTAVNNRWKYAYSAPDDREFLLDRVEDPRETRNKAGIVFLREDLKGMRSATLEHLRRCGEEDALDGDGWRTWPKLEVPDDPDSGLLIQDAPWADATIPGYTDLSH